MLGSKVPLQRSSAEHFVFAEHYKGGGGNDDDGKGATDSIEHFNGIPLRAVRSNVVVHKLDDIATLEAMFRHIARQRCIRVEFKLHHVEKGYRLLFD